MRNVHPWEVSGINLVLVLLKCWMRWPLKMFIALKYNCCTKNQSGGVHVRTFGICHVSTQIRGKRQQVCESRILKVIDKEGHPYTLTAMGTIIEVEKLDDALKIVKKAYKQLEKDCNRVYSTIKLDIRKGAMGRLKQKIVSVERKVEKTVLVGFIVSRKH